MRTDSFVLSRQRPVEYITEGIVVRSGETGVTARQEIVPGFDQKVLDNLAVSLIGGGGLGGEIGEGLVRKGVGRISIFDGDAVEPSNLNRQLFFKEDLYRNKAICLAKNLSRFAIKKSRIIGYPFWFQEAVERGMDVDCDVAVCGVDNNETRVFVSRLYSERKTPVIFTAVSMNANHGYVFVQEPEKACFGCLFPYAVKDRTSPCPNSPAVKDILKVMGGIVIYAIDTLFMGRKRSWNFKQVFLAGFVNDITATIEKKGDCPLCGSVK